MLYPRMVLARLQAQSRKSEQDSDSTAKPAAEPKEASKSKKAKKGVQPDIERKLLPEQASCAVFSASDHACCGLDLPSVWIAGYGKPSGPAAFGIEACEAVPA